MKHLIVNADDYGHTPGVSEGIRQAHLEGIVTSTSAMMNRPSAPSELEKAGALCPKLGIGVHLVLTTGKPLLPPEKLTTLTRADGSFYRQDDLVNNIDQVDLDQVDAEWHAQVEKFIKVIGHGPDHLDSHHHSSYFTPAIFERMLRLAEELHCPIRKPFGDESADPADYLPVELARKYRGMYEQIPGDSRLRTTDRFFGDFYDEGATLEQLEGIMDLIGVDPRNETFEIMCHPAVVDAELMAVSSYNVQRGRELKVLKNSGLANALRSKQIELINFANLPYSLPGR